MLRIVFLKSVKIGGTKMKKILALILMIAALAFIITGCGTAGGGDVGTGGGQAAGGGTGGAAAGNQDNDVQGGRANIIIATAADIVSLDPHASNDAPSSDVNRQIYSSLLRTNTAMEFVPDLALSWENISPTEWQFNIRLDIAFHD